MIREIIKEALDLNEIKPSVLANAVGIRRTRLIGFLSGRYNLNLSNIECIIDLLGIKLSKGKLPIDRRISLEQMSTKKHCTSKRDTNWYNMFEEVKCYHEKTGSWPSCHKHKKLGAWCVFQRLNKKRGKISTVRKQMLDSIGFDWGVTLKDEWQKMYNELKSYREKTGRWPCPRSENKEEAKLGVWLYNQRSVANGNRGRKMPQEHLEKLEAINFKERNHQRRNKRRTGKDNKSRLSDWDMAYQAVKEYKLSTGKWPAPSANDIKISNLCEWCNRQREYMKRGALGADKQEKLNNIEFQWVLRSYGWDKRYETVKQYKESTGCLPAASSKDAEIAKLGRWCNLQKYRKIRGKLSPEKQIKLKSIGIE